MIKRFAVFYPGESRVLAYVESTGIVRAGRITRRFLREEVGGLMPFILVDADEVRRGWHSRGAEEVYDNHNAPTIPG